MFAFVVFIFGTGVWMITGGAKSGAAQSPPGQERSGNGSGRPRSVI
jgi:hypothetical protein